MSGREEWECLKGRKRGSLLKRDVQAHEWRQECMCRAEGFPVAGDSHPLTQHDCTSCSISVLAYVRPPRVGHQSDVRANIQAEFIRPEGKPGNGLQAVEFNGGDDEDVGGDDGVEKANEILRQSMKRTGRVSGCAVSQKDEEMKSRRRG